MIYGSVEFMDIPWETVIKEFRKRLGARKYNTLGEYAAKFLSFLTDDKTVSPSEAQRAVVVQGAVSEYQAIEHAARRAITEKIQAESNVRENFCRAAIDKAVRTRFGELTGAERIPGLPRDFEKDFRNAYRKTIGELVQRTFAPQALARECLNMLRQIPEVLFSREAWRDDTRSGVVIVGFGDKEIFPQIRACVCDAVVAGHLRCRMDPKQGISRNLGAIIRSFAQGEMVFRFMEGIDPAYLEFVHKMVRGMVEGCFNISVLDGLKLSVKKKAGMQKKLGEEAQSFLEQVDKGLKAKSEEYAGPIMKVVGILPKDELAAMAESLVSLTSFKRKVTMNQQETVGGPVDVAVISKGDGFIGIKRKHYFPPDLNPDFVTRKYMREDSDG